MSSFCRSTFGAYILRFPQFFFHFTPLTIDTFIGLPCYPRSHFCLIRTNTRRRFES